MELPIDSPEYNRYLNKVEHFVRNAHEPTYEFHNADHPLMETAPAARGIAEYCMAQEIKLDLLVIDTSSRTHDVYFHEPLNTSCFPTREKRSAQRTGAFMRQLLVPESQIRRTQLSIITTERHHPYIYVEDAILGYADMINTYSDYDEMLIKTFLLRSEVMREIRKPITAEEWLAGSISVIGDYHAKQLPQRLRQLELFKDLQEKGKENLDRLRQETPKSFLDKTMPRITDRAAS